MDGYSRLQTTVSKWESQARVGLDEIKSLHNVSSSRYPDKSDETYAESDRKWIESGYSDDFWRLLCGDMMYASGDSNEGTYRRAEEHDQQLFTVFAEVANSLNRLMSRMTVKGKRTFYTIRPEASNYNRNQFFYAMQIMTAGRTLFVMEQGRMGVGPSSTAPGDHVAVLAGSTVPFLLRHGSKMECQGGVPEVILPRRVIGMSETVPCHKVHQCYNIVGDAYVAGIMDGQIAEAQVSEIYLE